MSYLYVSISIYSYVCTGRDGSPNTSGVIAFCCAVNGRNVKVKSRLAAPTDKCTPTSMFFSVLSSSNRESRKIGNRAESSPLRTIQIIAKPRFSWGRIECYVPSADRYHTAKPTPNPDTDDKGAPQDWSVSWQKRVTH